MAKNVKYVTNLQGLNELMKSEEMQKALSDAGQAVANAAGDGYEVETTTINWIGITKVSPTTAKAQKDNLENNTLLTALGSTGLRMTK